MVQKRFPKLAIINIERDMFNYINNNDVLEKYNKADEYRINKKTVICIYFFDYN